MEDKQFGEWFDKLLQLMKSRASCRPGEAIEPGSSHMQDVDDENKSSGKYFGVAPIEKPDLNKKSKSERPCNIRVEASFCSS